VVFPEKINMSFATIISQFGYPALVLGTGPGAEGTNTPTDEAARGERINYVPT
jgi:hypothetical protein